MDRLCAGAENCHLKPVPGLANQVTTLTIGQLLDETKRRKRKTAYDETTVQGVDYFRLRPTPVQLSGCRF